jgi:hypothetical protein
VDYNGVPALTTYEEFAFAGGVAGYVYGFSNAVTIENCENDANISAVNLNLGLRAYAGGIAGHVDSADGDNAGVIVKNCANLGVDKTVYTSAGTTMTGGLFGSTSFHDFDTPNIILQNSYNVSSVLSESNSAPAKNGMCVGITAGGIIGAAGEISVNNTYSTAASVSAVSLNGADGYEGGIFGVLYLTSASRNYYEENSEIIRAVGASGDLLQAPDDLAGAYEGATAAELKTRAFFAGWPWYTSGGIAPDYYSSTNPWRMTDAGTYPVLKGEAYTEPTTPPSVDIIYSITASSSDGGTITPSGITTLLEYSSKTFTITPEQGYKISDVHVDGVSVGTVATYTFSSVTANHTIEAKFEHDCPSKKFTDVDISQWYHEGIDFVLLNGLFNGTSDTTFEPNADMTRAMLVTVLWRLETQPNPTASNTFADVDSGTWYTDAVAWAAENDIVEGYDADTFGPNDPITREQMAAILYRYASYKGYDLTASNDLAGYTDSGNVSAWALTAMKWAVAEELITGVSETSLDPSGNASRAQVATILMRFVENIVK